jgi:DNA replication protein DnaC
VIVEEIDRLAQKMAAQDVSPSIADIERQYQGRSVMAYKSRRERYKEQWETGPDMSLIKSAVKRRDLSFEEAKEGFIIIIREAISAKGRALYIYEPNKAKLNNILHVMIGSVQGDYPVAKGIYLYGRYSSGKTWIMEHLGYLLKNAYYSMQFNNLSVPYMVSYKNDIMMRARREKDIAFIDTIFKDKKLIIIDDLGYEDDSQLVLWGNRENIMIHLIDILYRCFHNGSIIHFTSNLQLRHPDPATPCIFKRYGQGTHDRMYEMTTPVFWDSDINLRTNKLLGT